MPPSVREPVSTSHHDTSSLPGPRACDGYRSTANVGPSECRREERSGQTPNESHDRDRGALGSHVVGLARIEGGKYSDRYRRGDTLASRVRCRCATYVVRRRSLRTAWRLPLLRGRGHSRYGGLGWDRCTAPQERTEHSRLRLPGWKSNSMRAHRSQAGGAHHASLCRAEHL
jgi:hypothetical protein